MPFLRYAPEWTGFTGAPGFSVFHFNNPDDVVDPNALAAAVAAFFQDWAPQIPTIATISYPSEITSHNNEGVLLGSFPVTVVPPATDCTGVGVYAAPVGARMQWNTQGIVNGRRVRGRTFLVPLVASAFEANGTLSTAPITAGGNAGAGLIADSAAAGAALSVWSQPFAGVPARAGSVHPVTGFSVPDQATVLRSRRD